MEISSDTMRAIVYQRTGRDRAAAVCTQDHSANIIPVSTTRKPTQKTQNPLNKGNELPACVQYGCYVIKQLLNRSVESTLCGSIRAGDKTLYVLRRY